MKPLPLFPFTLFSIGLVLSAASVRADDSVPPPPPPPAPAAPQASPADGGEPTPTPAPHHRRQQGYSLDQLTAKLGLTADQQKTVGDIIASGQNQMKALHSDDSLSKEDKRAKMKEIMTSTHNQIRAALTADQQAQFDAMSPHGGKPRSPDNN